MRFALLGSGSRGNAALIECRGTCVMLDCGFSARAAQARLARLGRDGADLAGILVTHEHGDHMSGLGAVARQYDLTVWMTPGTHDALAARVGELPAVELFSPHEPFAIGDLRIEPFPVPHDAREPSQFVFTDGDRRLGVLTDTGCGTPQIEAALSGCHALVLECNHDLELLWGGRYPQALKQRIAGRCGHLDNAAAAALLASVDTRHLQHLVAAHLSETNNTPELARAALAHALDADPDWIAVADQAQGLSWRALAGGWA